jgi:hypothetical protein
MDVKGWKAVGNRLSDQMLGGVKEIDAVAGAVAVSGQPESAIAPQQASLFGEEDVSRNDIPAEKPEAKEAEDKKTYKAGDTIEFD